MSEEPQPTEKKDPSILVRGKLAKVATVLAILLLPLMVWHPLSLGGSAASILVGTAWLLLLLRDPKHSDPLFRLAWPTLVLVLGIQTISYWGPREFRYLAMAEAGLIALTAGMIVRTVFHQRITSYFDQRNLQEAAQVTSDESQRDSGPKPRVARNELP